jgi:hypothetical protein
MINNRELLIFLLNAVYCFTLVRLKEDFGYVLSQGILDTASREYFKITMQKKLSAPFYCFLVLNETPVYLFLSQEASNSSAGQSLPSNWNRIYVKAAIAFSLFSIFRTFHYTSNLL